MSGSPLLRILLAKKEPGGYQLLTPPGADMPNPTVRLLWHMSKIKENPTCTSDLTSWSLPGILGHPGMCGL